MKIVDRSPSTRITFFLFVPIFYLRMRAARRMRFVKKSQFMRFGYHTYFPSHRERETPFLWWETPFLWWDASVWRRFVLLFWQRLWSNRNPREVLLYFFGKRLKEGKNNRQKCENCCWIEMISLNNKKFSATKKFYVILINEKLCLRQEEGIGVKRLSRKERKFCKKRKSGCERRNTIVLTNATRFYPFVVNKRR